MQHCQAHPLGEILSGCLAFTRPLDLAFGFHSLRIDLRGQLTGEKPSKSPPTPGTPETGQRQMCGVLGSWVPTDSLLTTGIQTTLCVRLQFGSRGSFSSHN